MSQDKTNITYPMLLNELYKHGLIQSLPAQGIAFIHAIMYKANQLWFPASMRISNTEIQSLANLSSKQLSYIRPKSIDLINEAINELFPMGEANFIIYQPSGIQDKAGIYLLNYDRIIAGQAPDEHRTTTGQTPDENTKNVRQSSGNANGFGNDPNITQSQFKETTTNNKDNKVEEEEFYNDIVERLKVVKMKYPTIQKLLREHGLSAVIDAYNIAIDKCHIGDIRKDKIAGYIIGTLNNEANS